MLTVLLVVVWIGSGWWTLGSDLAGGRGLTLMAGRVVFAYPFSVSGMQPYFTTGRLNAACPFESWFDWGPWNGIRYVSVPLWLPALLSLLATAFAWRADLNHLRRTRAGLCPACGYDRAGLVAEAVCPECGAEQDASVLMDVSSMQGRLAP